jgi:hypothetical protein
MTPVGSMHFSLFGAFGNNVFSLFSFSVGANPVFGQPNPMQGFIPSQGAMTEVYSSKVLEIPGRARFLRKGCRSGETPPTLDGTSNRVQYLCQEGRLGASPTKVLGILCREKSLHKACHSTTRIRRRCRIKRKLLLLDRATTVSTKTLPSSETLPGNLVPTKIQPLFSFESTTTKTTFPGNSAFAKLVKTGERPNMS